MRALQALPVLLLLEAAGGLGASEDPCANADALRKVGHLGPAQEAYAVVLGGSEEVPCALAGLERVAEVRGEAIAKQELGLRYADAELYTRARGVLSEALELDHSLAEAAAALASLGEEADEPEEKTEGLVSERLALAGFREEATAKLAEEIGDGEELGTGIMAPFVDHRLPLWRGFLLTVLPWVWTFAEIVAAVTLVALSVGRVFLRRFMRPRLSFQDLTGQDDGTGIGAALSKLVRSELQQVAAPTDRGRIDLVTGEVTGIEFPESATGALPLGVSWIAGIPALISWLWPRANLTVSGSLHDDPVRGPGATLVVASEKRVVATEAFWLRQLEPESRAHDAGDEGTADLGGAVNYYGLSLSMACWLMFHIPRRGDRIRGHRILGTSDWRSFVWFESGLRAQKRRDGVAAMQCFRSALDRDPLMRGAALNLGRLLARTVPREDPDDGQLRVLSDARELFADAKREAGGLGDPVGFAASYSLAIADFRLGHHESAYEQIKALTKRIAGALRWTRSLGRSDRADYFDSILPLAQAVEWGLAIRRGGESSQARKERAAAERELKAYYGPRRRGHGVSRPLSHRARYNLACSLSILAKAGGPSDSALAADPVACKAELEAIELSALELLLEALRGNWSMREEYRVGDPTLQHITEKHGTRIEQVLVSFPDEGTGNESAESIPPVDEQRLFETLKGVLLRTARYVWIRG